MSTAIQVRLQKHQRHKYGSQRGIGHVTWFLAKFKPRHNHYGVQTDDVSIITYILLSDLNFAVHIGQY